MRSIALTTFLLLATACGPTANSESSAPTPSGMATSNTTTFTMPAEREMVSFSADGGALIAYSTKDAPPPYASKIWRADPATGAWRVVYDSDARFMIGGVDSGRIAFEEYREEYQGGGAYSEIFVIVDIATGTRTEIDRFALTAATYRGGGGAPRRPVAATALGPGHVAWTRLVEGAGGVVTGELRVAPLANPAAAKLVATSKEWVRPLHVDARRLVYVLADGAEESLRVLDLGTGSDAAVLTAPVGDTVRGEIPGFDFSAISGDWAVWMQDAKSPESAAHAINLVTREERKVESPGTSCLAPSAGSRYFALTCSKATSSGSQPLLILDTKTLHPVTSIPVGTGVGTIAAGDGLIWFNVPAAGRTVTLYRPRS